ncbi:uncharacterized protein VTP21DRAFT_2962 [Calcarisporiella thermophila]|uniref:uncharacterized protein n=1 Tax=Calcarisporiella thermophila TaxID=911321 RepID=UPI0037427D8E
MRASNRAVVNTASVNKFLNLEYYENCARTHVPSCLIGPTTVYLQHLYTIAPNLLCSLTLHLSFVQFLVWVADTWQAVKSCYEIFPFNNTIATQTLDTVADVMDSLYVYRDVVKAPPDSRFNQTPVDLVEEINALRNKQYTKDLDFHTDLSKVIGKGRDGHLRYCNRCYCNRYVFHQPLLLYAPVDSSGHQQIKVLGMLASTQTHPSLEKRNFTGCSVARINGEEALAYLRKWSAVNVPGLKDPSVGFTHSLASMSHYEHLGGNKFQFRVFSGDFAMRTVLPESSHVSYTLKCETPSEPGSEFEINMPWFSRRISGNWTNSDEYWKQACMPTFDVKDSAYASPSPDVQLVEQPALDSEKMGVEVVAADGKTAFVILPQPQGRPKTGVFIYSSVYPHNSTDSVWHENAAANERGFLENIVKGLTAFKERSVQNLIIDVSHNGGGQGCLAEMILANLLNETQYPSRLSQYPSENLASPKAIRLAQEFRRQGLPWVWGANVLFADENTWTNTTWTNTTWTNTTWLERPFREYSYGGSTANYTDRYRTDCAPMWTRHADIIKNFPKHSWGGENIRVISQGDCGSACVYLPVLLQREKKVKIVTLGGFPDTPMTYYSYPGNEVVDYKDFPTSVLHHPEVDILKNSENADLFRNFRPLPTRSYLSYTIRRAFFTDSGSDMVEYTFTSGDERLYFDQVSATAYNHVWNQVANMF